MSKIRVERYFDEDFSTNLKLKNLIKEQALYDNRFTEPFKRPYADESAEKYAKEIISFPYGSDKLLFMALDGYDVIGFAYVVFDRPANGETRAYMRELYVTPSKRHLGAGTKLLDAVKQWCLKYRIDNLSLTCVNENDESIKFCEACGMIPVKTQFFLPL